MSEWDVKGLGVNRVKLPCLAKTKQNTSIGKVGSKHKVKSLPGSTLKFPSVLSPLQFYLEQIRTKVSRAFLPILLSTCNQLNDNFFKNIVATSTWPPICPQNKLSGGEGMNNRLKKKERKKKNQRFFMHTTYTQGGVGGL